MTLLFFIIKKVLHALSKCMFLLALLVTGEHYYHMNFKMYIYNRISFIKHLKILK